MSDSAPDARIEKMLLSLRQPAHTEKTPNCPDEAQYRFAVAEGLVNPSRAQELLGSRR